MPRKTLFAAVAVICFGLGLAAERLSGVASRLEPLALERLAPAPDLAEVYAGPALPPSDEEETDAVYSALVRELYVGEDTELIVLGAEGGGRFGARLTAEQEAESDRKLLGAWARAMPEAQAETLADHLARGKRARALRPLPNLGVRQALLSEAEMRGFFYEYGPGLGWEGFYLKYHGADGLITLSPAGFNRARTQAFLSFGKTCGGLCGSGGHALLEKRGGRWLVVRWQVEWVS